MMSIFAKIISFIFHPLLMPIFGLFIVFNTNSYLTYVVPLSVKNIVYITVVVFTIVLPIINTYFLIKSGLIKTLSVNTIRERRLVCLLAIVYYVICYYFLKQIPLPPVLYLIFLGAILSVFFAFLINFSWKISVHMIGIGGLVGTLIGLSLRFMENLQLVVILLIFCAGIVGFARLKLDAHKPSQVYGGFFIGVFSEIVLLSGIW